MKIENFVIFPRKILTDLRSGDLTLNEYAVYCYTRLSGNPYGIAITSLENIRNDLFKGRVGTNYCNKLILSLKSKGYVDYSPRSGRRGSFEVHLGDWVLPNKQIKTLRQHAEQDGVRDEGITSDGPDTEVGKSYGVAGQSFQEKKTQLIKAFDFTTDSLSVRGSYNDNENEKEKDKYVDRSKNPFKEEEKILVEGYESKNGDECRCWEIAKGVGEKCMNYILSVLSKHGLPIIEEAYGIFREDTRKKKIRNRGAYFNGIIGQLLKGRESNNFQ